MKVKVEMPVGKRVKGYGMLNEYGEFDFTPTQVGINAGKTKIIKEDEDFSVKESVNFVLVNFRLPKGKRMQIIKLYLNVMNKILNVLNTYEI